MYRISIEYSQFSTYLILETSSHLHHDFVWSLDNLYLLLLNHQAIGDGSKTIVMITNLVYYYYYRGIYYWNRHVYAKIMGIFFADTFILSFNITSDPASPITEGTAVTLTCTVKLNTTLMQPPAVSVSPVEKQSSK